MKFSTAIITASLLCGCASSTITAFKDPAFENVQFHTVAVMGAGMSLASTVEVEKQVCEKMEPVTCFQFSSLQPPTRIYTPDELLETLSTNKVEAVLVIDLIDDKSETRYQGTINNSTANTYSNSTGYANFIGNSAQLNSQTHSTTYRQSMAVPIYKSTRSALAKLTLFDTKTGSTAWTGEIQVTGKGKAISDSAFIDSATDEIVETLKDALLVN